MENHTCGSISSSPFYSIHLLMYVDSDITLFLLYCFTSFTSNVLQVFFLTCQDEVMMKISWCGDMGTFRLGGSGEVLWLFYIDVILTEGRDQVLHGQRVLVVPSLASGDARACALQSCWTSLAQPEMNFWAAREMS